MASTLNKVMLIGHTGDDIKMHYFDENNCIGRFPIATNEEYVNKSTGERISNTEWHNVVVRNKVAETLEKYLKKGDKVYVEGRIKTRKWQDDKGMDRYSTEIHCTEFSLLSSKSGTVSEEKTPSSSTHSSEPIASKSPATHSMDDKEDDLPF